LLCDDQPLKFTHKTPKKPLQLLKALIAFGGRNVSQKKITDALWPDLQADEALSVLNVALSRLRKILAQDSAVEQIGGRLSLNLNVCWADALAFERLLDVDRETPPEAYARALHAALRLYRGSFLEDEAEAPWAVSYRERLRRKFVRSVSECGVQLERDGDLDSPITLYHRGIEADEFAEEFYRGLMRCLAGSGRKAEAMSVFRRLRQTLSITLGITPSTETRALFDSLRE